MESRDTIVIAVLLAVAAASIYRKYIKKNQNRYGEGKATQTRFDSTDDDYEPYSGK